jgi:hypothetical protein
LIAPNSDTQQFRLVSIELAGYGRATTTFPAPGKTSLSTYIFRPCRKLEELLKEQQL